MTDVNLRLMSNVVVKVSGIAGGGKTAIATLIEKTLIGAGFTSVVMEDPEQTIEARYEGLNAVLEEKNPDYFCKSITIVTEHTPRNKSGG